MSKIAHGRKRALELYGRASDLTSPAVAWNASQFKSVDDRVRGGSSQSRVEVTSSEDGADGRGELKFSGFLDTTTLGGAGFASQQHFTEPAFPVTLNATEYSGLSLRVRSRDAKSTRNVASPVPGGGKGPVISYNLNLYTSAPQQRPDGRNYSSIVYEADFNITSPTAVYNDNSGGTIAAEKRSTTPILAFDLPFTSFKPTYRGRPADDAEPLDPSKIALWSIMARSNFNQQSGPFDLQLSSLWAVPSGDDTPSIHPHARCLEDAFTPAKLTGSPGFALYLLATLAFVAWILWALTPDAVLKKFGIEWYPDREWAFLLPAFSLVVVLIAYITYMAINLRMTPELTHLSTVVDAHTNPPHIKRADEMTFDDAVQYYAHEHPYGPRAPRPTEGGRRMQGGGSAAAESDRHARDLPPQMAPQMR